jgi:hypothetical protein
MPKRPTVRYSGILAEPVLWEYPRPSILLGDPTPDEVDRMAQANSRQLAERMAALFRHYGINPADDFAFGQLALKLAIDWVPGFQVVFKPPKGVGRPSKWKGGIKGVELFADVKALVRKGHSERAACRILATSPKYAERYKGEKERNLHRRYLEALKNAPSFFRKLMERNQSAGAPVETWVVEVFALDANEWREKGLKLARES